MRSCAAWLSLLALLCGAGPVEAKRARVAVFLLPAAGYTPQVVARVSDALQRALASDPRLEVKDADKLLVEYAGESPTERIAQARTAYEEGMATLQEGKAAEAIPSLERAVSIYEEVLAFVKKDLLAQASLALGAAQASARQPRKAYSTFVALLTWRPQLPYDTSRFDPAHLPLFEKARAAVKKLKRGSVEFATNPPGARAYVDGRFMGVTPTAVFGLVVGEHYAAYKQAGFIKAAQKITVSGTEQRRYSLELARSNSFALLKESVDGAKRVMGQPAANDAMVNLKSLLVVDQVVFATMGYAGPGRITVQAFLYDLRSRQRLNMASLSLEVRSLQELSGLARNLYLNVRTDGSLEVPPDAPPPPPPKRKRFYTTWWFWSAIAVGTAAVVVGATMWPSSKTCGDACRWARF